MKDEIESYINALMGLYREYTDGLYGSLTVALNSGTSAHDLTTKLTVANYTARERIKHALYEYSDLTFGHAFEYLMRGQEDNPLNSHQISMMDNFLEDSRDLVTSSIMRQLDADQKKTMVEYRRHHISVSLNRQAGMSLGQAHDQANKKLSEGIGLFRTDAAGRKWKSDRFVETELNVLFYQLANIVSVYILIMMGEVNGRIQREGHELDNWLFELNKYEELQSTLFHPNAKALVVPV